MLTPVTPNPITTSTTIKSHGSESRTAPGHNTVEAQVVPQAGGHSGGVGLDAGTILANVNAEAATAGNRTILQTLALAVAAQLNIVRRNDETMEAFFLRIAAALDEMTPDEREATELQAGLKLLKIQIPAFSAALKQPDSALAARLSAMAETPLATPQKTAAAAATTSYLQEAPGVSRAAETLAMVAQARSNTDGSGIFSSTPAPAAPEKQPADPRSLQTQLKTLFEPGVAETRIEIATKEEPSNVLVLDRTGDDPQAPVALPAATDALQAQAAETVTTEQSAQVDEQPLEKQVDARQADVRAVDVKPADAKPAEARQADQRPVDLRQADAEPLEANLQDANPLDAKQPDARPADTRLADIRQAAVKLPLLLTKAESTPAVAAEPPVSPPAERRSEPKMPGLPAPQNNNYPNATSMLRAIARELVREKFDNGPDFGSRREDGDHRMQTMLTLKGIAEVITAMPSKAAEFLMSPQLVADIKAKQAKANVSPASMPGDAAVRAGEAEAPRSEGAAVRKDVTTTHHSALPASPMHDAAEQEARLAAGHADAKAQSAARSMESGSAAAEKTSGGTSLDPVPFAFAALQPAKEEFKAEATEERGRHEDDGEDADGEEREDPEARRERLARKATDDLLRPEPEADPDVKITRDSSQADRAYALYQRMAGF